MSEKTAGKPIQKVTRKPNRGGQPDPEPKTEPAGEAVLEPEPLVVLPGFERVAPAWWAAVAQVYEALLDEKSNLETVSTAFHNELMARFAYAKALHERGYRVPDYLAERAPISPLWPLPELPTLIRQVTRAA